MIGDDEDLDRCADCGEYVDECVCYISYDGEEYGPYDGYDGEYDTYDGEEDE